MREIFLHRDIFVDMNVGARHICVRLVVKTSESTFAELSRMKMLEVQWRMIGWQWQTVRYAYRFIESLLKLLVSIAICKGLYISATKKQIPEK